jgi:hypothetical protein
MLTRLAALAQAAKGVAKYTQQTASAASPPVDNGTEPGAAENAMSSIGQKTGGQVVVVLTMHTSSTDYAY